MLYAICSAPLAKGWGFEYLHCYYPKRVVKVEYWIWIVKWVIVFQTILLKIFTVTNDDDDDVCNLCLASI